MVGNAGSIDQNVHRLQECSIIKSHYMYVNRLWLCNLEIQMNTHRAKNSKYVLHSDLWNVGSVYNTLTHVAKTHAYQISQGEGTKHST